MRTVAQPKVIMHRQVSLEAFSLVREISEKLNVSANEIVERAIRALAADLERKSAAAE
jgi:hypothetical protein